MSRREDYSLLVVRGDGARVLRFTVPRRLVAFVAALVTTLAVGVGVLAVDWLELHRLTRQVRPHFPQILEQRAALEEVHGKIVALRQEVAGWREIHARLFEAFGPDGHSRPRDKGIGGPGTPLERMLGRLSPQDEVARLAESLAEETRSLRILDALMARAARMLAAIPNRWPVRGAVNSEFGTRLSPWTKTAEFHGGMDIRAERGTPVQAPANGTVTIAGPHAEYGLTVILDHGNDIRSIYGHLSKVRVKVGDRVERGAELGLTGNTGRSSGPHLHYEVLVKGQAVNPRTYLWE